MDETHYSKSQIFVHKFNFDKTPTFSWVFHPNFFWQFFSLNQSCQQLKSPKPQHFHEFFNQIFLTIFLVKSKLSTANKSKTTTFSRGFHPKKSTIFSENQSWIFGQKMKISNSAIQFQSILHHYILKSEPTLILKLVPIGFKSCEIQTAHKVGSFSVVSIFV